MKLNLKRLKKDEILWLASHKCRHGHYFIEHLNCFLIENPQSSPLYEHIGILDIETTGLKGDYGFILSYAIKELDGKVIGRVLAPQEIREGKFDEQLLRECVVNMRKFDKLITYYGGDFRFDVPTIRTRAIKYKIDFPLFKEIKVVDLYSIVKKKLNLHNRRLGTVCSFFDIESKEHKMNPDIWSGAISGNKKALKWIWTHNIEDCISTEKLYKRIIDYVGAQNQSI